MPKLKKVLILIFCFSVIGIGSENCASRVVYVRQAPPQTKIEVHPVKPFSNAIWISGYWRYNGRQYVWISGRWTKPKKDKVWVTGHWKRDPRGWHYVPGHWR